MILIASLGDGCGDAQGHIEARPLFAHNFFFAAPAGRSVTGLDLVMLLDGPTILPEALSARRDGFNHFQTHRFIIQNDVMHCP